MAGARARGRPNAAFSNTRGGRGRQAKRTAQVEDPIAELYKEMLEEAASSTATVSGDEERPLKRRRVGRNQAAPKTEPPAADNTHVDASTTDHSSLFGDNELREDHIPIHRQTITDYSEEESESEMEWEEVGLQPTAIPSEDENAQPAEAEKGGLTIVMGGPQASKKTTTTRRRKGVSSAEKSMRLDVHKIHVLCLLAHVHIRNAWCNDPKVQTILRRLLNPRIVSYLNPESKFTQFQKSSSLMDGLSQVSDIWKAKFNITALGMKRSRWAVTEEALKNYKLPDDSDPVHDRADFRKAAAALEGSPDVGAQLLCALLRSAGVEARLVCSLQPLPFSASAQAVTPPVKSHKATVYAGGSADDRGNTSDESASKGLTRSAAVVANAVKPGQIKRIGRAGQIGFAGNSNVDLGRPPPLQVPKKKIPRPAHPIYWVEAFNEAHQKWVPVDPLATMTVGKPSRLEPPANDPNNAMSYVVAFEEDGVARDVTRRYAKAYNAKTRKLRVESTDGGAKWWKKAMKIFRRREVLDRDQVEDAELAKKEAAEDMPRNIQDYKDHPYYVLERHLRHNEVIYPKHEIGKVNAGTSASVRLEPIYRRRDMHVVRSADKWYRFGREVKAGEQPLKRGKPRKRGRRLVDEQGTGDESGDESAGVALYALFQTEIYVPPPVVRGRVPRNAYGNLDVYVPSMIPKGGVHIKSPDAARATRLIGVDYADAVVGFQFKGRHGTAIVQGAVVAEEYREAVEAVIDGFSYAREEAEDMKRSVEALRLWKRFLIGLRIVERVKGYEIEGEEKGVQAEIDKMEDYADRDDEDGGGGFLPDVDNGPAAEPTAGHFAVANGFGGGFFPEQDNHMDDPERIEEDLRPAPVRRRRRILLSPSPSSKETGSPADYNGQAGGFIVDDTANQTMENAGSSIPSPAVALEDDNAGGFLPESPLNEPGTQSESPKVDPQIRNNISLNEVRHDDSEQKGQPDTNSTTPSEMSRNNVDADVEVRDFEHNESEDPLQQDRRGSEPHTEPTIDEPEPSEDDRGSLLSHDPEDEDADPDWLV